MKEVLYATEGHFVKLVEVSPEDETLEILAKRFQLNLHQLLQLQTHNQLMEKVIIVERFGICASIESQERPWFNGDAIANILRGRANTVTIAALGSRRSHLLQATTCRMPSTLFGQFGSEAQFAIQSAPLAVDVPETNLVNLLEIGEFQERLVWGRQRGLAIIFAAEAAPSDERYCLDAASFNSCTAPEAHCRNTPGLHGTASGGHEDHEAQELQRLADPLPDDSSCPFQSCLIKAGNGLYLEKLVIDEDAASIEGPPTPDNEESGKVNMPATKRQRVSTTSPTALAASFARALFLI
ncbi:hypothetical protein COCOBI_04-6040 [Coccomyxa sp. Obi]|nr:hypothetical protein COCOBI_04-6040 [Coccomyxa sp. Obi]